MSLKKGEMVFVTASNEGTIYKIAAWPELTSLDAPRTFMVAQYVPFDDHKPIWSLESHVSHCLFFLPLAYHQAMVQ